MRGEGKAFGHYQKFTLDSIDVVCHDVAHYEHRGYLYVGCVSAKSTPTNPGAVFIATWAYEQQKVTHIEITNQDDGFRILNRLGMFVTEKSSSTGTVTPYLVAYDVGNTNAKEHRGNDQLRVYRNVNIGKLRYYKLLKVDDHQYDIVYNMFPYYRTIILSGRVNGPTSSILTLAQCVLNFQKDVVTCDPDLKGTAVTEGMVGLNLSGHYFEINSETRKITVAHLRGSFHDANWNRDVIYSQDDLHLIHNESAYIRYYTGNGILGTINYGTVAGGPDFGYTGISYESGISWGVEGHVAANIGSSIVFGRSDQTGEHEGDVISIMRPDKPYLLVDTHHLPVGEKSVVGVTVSDQNSGPLSTSGSVTVVKSIFDKINVLSSAFGDISLTGGHEHVLRLHEDDIVEGNSIQIKATSEGGVVKGQSFSGAKLNIEWRPDHDHNDVLMYSFAGMRAIVQNNRGKMWFYKCRYDMGHHDRVCEQYASYPGPISQPIRRVQYVNHVLFTWMCTNDDCMGVFVQDDGDVSTVSLGTGIRDMYISHDNQVPNWLRLVASLEGKVEIFRGPKYEPEGMSLWYTITEHNSEEDWFCPTHIYHCPDNDDVLEIMNDCQGYNQKILKYKINDMKITLWNKTNLDSLNNAPFFCPMGDEFIVGSTSSQHTHPLYSFGTHDDLNFWSVPPSLLGDNFWNYSCLSHIKRFVSYGFDKDGSVTATVIVGNRGSEQLRRYSNVVSGIEASAAYAFEGIEGGIVHWFTTENGPLFYETFDTPALELEAAKVDKKTEVEVTFTFSN